MGAHETTASNICVICGKPEKLYQHNMCKECLKPALRRMSAFIDSEREAQNVEGSAA